MKFIIKIAFALIFLMTAPALLYADVTVEFHPADIPATSAESPLNPFDTFTARVMLTSPTPLRGIALAFRTHPIGVINVKSLTPLYANNPAGGRIMKYSDITKRMTLFDNAGINFATQTAVAEIEFQAPQRNYTAPSADLIINVLQFIESGSMVPAKYTVEIPTVHVLYQPAIPPTPTPTVTTPPSPPTPTPRPGENSGALYTAFGGCGTVASKGNDRIPYEYLLLILPLLSILLYKRKYLIVPIIFVALTAAFLIPRSIFAATYYVDKTDSNCSDGAYSGRESVPFCTIGRALNETLLAGDIIEIKGTLGNPYEEGILEIDRFKNGNGVVGIPITLRAQSQDTAAINGGTTPAIVILTFTQHWTIENLTFINGGDWPETYERPDYDPSPVIVGGEEVGTGIIIRSNKFSGTVSSNDSRKNIVTINSPVSFPRKFYGHLIENNSFESPRMPGDGFAFVSLIKGEYSRVRFNSLIYTGNPLNESPSRHINVQDSGYSIIERNFSAGIFDSGLREAANISAIGQSPPPVIRNNILYMDSYYTSGHSPMAGIYIRSGPRLANNPHRIHNNSIQIDMSGSSGDEVDHVAGVYTGYSSSSSESATSADAVNNIIVGGDFAASGMYYWCNENHSIWPNCWVNGGDTEPNYRFDYNDTWNTDPPYSARFWLWDNPDGLDHRYMRCYMGWWDSYTEVTKENCEADPALETTLNMQDTLYPYGGAGTVYQASRYTTLAGGSQAATHTWSTQNRCTNLAGALVACNGIAGATGGAHPYGTTTTETFCGDVYPAGSGDRVLDMRDVITLWDSGSAENRALAQRVADYIATLTLENPAEPDEGHLLPTCFD